MRQRSAFVVLIIAITCQWRPALGAQQPVTPQTPIATARPPAQASCRECEELAGQVNQQRKEIDRARARRDAADEAADLARVRFRDLQGQVLDAAPGSAERKRLEEQVNYWDREIRRRAQALEDAAEDFEDHVKAEARLMRELEKCNALCSFQPVAKTKTVLANPKVYGTVIGAVATTALLAGGGGNDTVATAPPTTAIPTTAAPPVTTPVATVPPTTPPPTTTTPPPTATDFSLTISGSGVDHVSPGRFSDLCSRFISSPAQPNAPFTVTISGPGAEQPSVTGTTDASGVGTFRARINAFGPYSFTITVTVNGVTRTITGNFTVTAVAVACPAP